MRECKALRFKSDPERSIALADHASDHKRCERAVEKAYIEHDSRRLTAKQFVCREEKTMFSQSAQRESLAFYMRHVMLLKLGNFESRDAIMAHPMWQVYDYALNMH